MPKVLFLKGLPASGKSTFAKELIAKEPDKWVRVNKDSLRSMLHDSKWSKGREKLVMQMHRAMAVDALKSGVSVIVDDTNFSPRHEVTYRDIAKQNNAEFELKEFTTPVDECIERDAKRKDSVGKDVILKMFYQFQCKTKPVMNNKLPNACIVDMDGTIALMRNRSAYEWDKVGCDELNTPVYMVIKALQDHDIKILIVSGRDGSCEQLTKDWLKNNNINYDGFWMRETGNNEKDTIIKKRIYDKHIDGKYNIICVFDDRPCVCRLWHSLGLFVFGCGLSIEF